MSELFSFLGRHGKAREAKGDRYTAIALQTSTWCNYKRGDENVKRNLDQIAAVIQVALSQAELDFPVKLVALPESAINGFTCDFLQMGHLRGVRELYGEIPCEETDFLGELCKSYGFYLIGEMLATDEEFMEDRFFNIAFIIDPTGNIIHKHHKTAFYPRERSTSPHDIWDVLVEKHGDDPKKLLELLFPVARTEIGNIGTIICAEGSFPEPARALALNGAEIIYRPSYPEPWVGMGTFEVQNRSHALFNTCYCIAPNNGYYKWAPDSPASNPGGGRTMIIDYRGQVISNIPIESDMYAAGIIDIEQLRDFRVRALWQNLLKDLRVEQYHLIYKAAEAMGGIYPKNLAIEEPPMGYADHDELLRYQVNKMVELGIYTAPKDWQPHAIKKEVIDRIHFVGKKS